MSYPPPFREVMIVYLSVHLLGTIEPDSILKKKEKEPKFNLCSPIQMILLTQPNLNQRNLFQLESSKTLQRDRDRDRDRDR